MKILSLILLLCSVGHATTMDCETFMNLEPFAQSKVETKLSQKVLVNKSDSATIYVTENSENQYVLEAFMPSLEIRIYSEAKINDLQDSIKLSLWDRDFIFDVVCKKIKP